jgi:hypothetical protein
MGTVSRVFDEVKKAYQKKVMEYIRNYNTLSGKKYLLCELYSLRPEITYNWIRDFIPSKLGVTRESIEKTFGKIKSGRMKSELELDMHPELIYKSKHVDALLLTLAKCSIDCEDSDDFIQEAERSIMRIKKTHMDTQDPAMTDCGLTKRKKTHTGTQDRRIEYYDEFMKKRNLVTEESYVELMKEYHLMTKQFQPQA